MIVNVKRRKPRCFKCEKKGHLKSNCKPVKKAIEEGKNSEEDN